MNDRWQKQECINMPKTYKKTEFEKRNDKKFFDEIRNIDNEKCFFVRGYDDVP